MFEGDGCQYSGCEDAVTSRRVVDDIDATAEVDLCARHETFVDASRADETRRTVLFEDGAGHPRVKVLLPARMMPPGATSPIHSDLAGRHVDKDVERWVRRLLAGDSDRVAATG